MSSRSWCRRSPAPQSPLPSGRRKSGSHPQSPKITCPAGLRKDLQAKGEELPILISSAKGGDESLQDEGRSLQVWLEESPGRCPWVWMRGIQFLLQPLYLFPEAQLHILMPLEPCLHLGWIWEHPLA